VILNYYLAYPDWANNKTERHLKIDTLIYKFGGFIEYNHAPAKHQIQKIEYLTDGCEGRCPIFYLEIDKNGEAIYNAIKFNDLEGEYVAKIDSIRFKELIDILNYIDFPKLDTSYSVSWTCDASIDLEITYNNGLKKTIHDYALVGTYGLSQTYRILSNLRENQKWVKKK
jgi:hypothetical protein